MEIRDKGIRGTRVEVVLKGGGTSEETILVPKGDPEKPLTREDITSKLKTCAGSLISKEHLQELISYLSSFGGDDTISKTILYGKGNTR